MRVVWRQVTCGCSGESGMETRQVTCGCGSESGMKTGHLWLW